MSRIFTGFRIDAGLARQLRADCAGRGERIQDRMTKLIASHLRRVEARKRKLDKKLSDEVR
jgi:hypothetical protein